MDKGVFLTPAGDYQIKEQKKVSVSLLLLGGSDLDQFLCPQNEWPCKADESFFFLDTFGWHTTPYLCLSISFLINEKHWCLSLYWAWIHIPLIWAASQIIYAKWSEWSTRDLHSEISFCLLFFAFFFVCLSIWNTFKKKRH